MTVEQALYLALVVVTIIIMILGVIEWWQTRKRGNPEEDEYFDDGRNY